MDYWIKKVFTASFCGSFRLTKKKMVWILVTWLLHLPVTDLKRPRSHSIFWPRRRVWIIIVCCWEKCFLWLSHSLVSITHPQALSFPHRADECKPFLVRQHWCVLTYGSIRERCLLVWFYFSSMSCSSYVDGLWDGR